LLLLTDRLSGILVTVSRLALLVFAVIYNAFDAAAGIGTGILVQYARSQSATDQAILEPAFQALFPNTTSGAVRTSGVAA
jgi:hypothetical protein